MIPPRFVPPGVLQLFKLDKDGTKELLQELPTSSKNRDRINRIRNDLLMVDSTLQLYVTENNAWKA
jgi:hypothetical protein